MCTHWTHGHEANQPIVEKSTWVGWRENLSSWCSIMQGYSCPEGKQFLSFNQTRQFYKASSILLISFYQSYWPIVNLNIMQIYIIYTGQSHLKFSHKARQNMEKNKYVSKRSQQALHFAYQICMLLLLLLFFRWCVCIKKSEKWLRETQIPGKKTPGEKNKTKQNKTKTKQATNWFFDLNMLKTLVMFMW